MNLFFNLEILQFLVIKSLVPDSDPELNYDLNLGPYRGFEINADPLV